MLHGLFVFVCLFVCFSFSVCFCFSVCSFIASYSFIFSALYLFLHSFSRSLVPSVFFIPFYSHLLFLLLVVLPLLCAQEKVEKLRFCMQQAWKDAKEADVWGHSRATRSTAYGPDWFAARKRTFNRVKHEGGAENYAEAA